MKCELVRDSRMLQDTLLQIHILVLDPTDVYAMHIYKDGTFYTSYILSA